NQACLEVEQILKEQNIELRDDFYCFEWATIYFNRYKIPTYNLGRFRPQYDAKILILPFDQFFGDSNDSTDYSKLLYNNLLVAALNAQRFYVLDNEMYAFTETQNEFFFDGGVMGRLNKLESIGADYI